MEGLFVLLIVLAVGCLICGPVALIISIIALSRSRQVYPPPAIREPRLPPIVPQAQEKPSATVPIASEGPTVEAAAESHLWPKKPVPQEAGPRMPAGPAGDIAAGKKPSPGLGETIKAAKEKPLLEQQIGTRWVLIAGVITTFFGVAFFLRYAYLHFSISDQVKVAIVTVGGLIALAVGEITRRRGYEIVAKGVTALGFAILYAAVFTAQLWYGLIGSKAAFLLAALVTAGAMVYAVVLDEILIAFLSLLGGFITPVIVSTGENLPMPLFTYVTILSVGAMLCACYRRWRTVDILSFVGTYLLYTGWFEKFYRPAMGATEAAPQQMAIALGWLGAFSCIYLVLPIIYELVRKVKARKENVLLVLGNAMVVFYYLWTILYEKYRTPLALCALGLCAAHLIMMAVVMTRCRDDLNLQQVLLAIALFFFTIAVPLYFKMNAVTIAWAAEAVILAIIGLRYRSVLTQIGAGAAFFLSCVNLAWRLPMHTGAFRLVLNPAFGTWCFVAGGMFVCHFTYRRAGKSPEDPYGTSGQILYTAAGSLLFAAATMEWYCHCHYNIAERGNYLLRGQEVIFAVTLLLFVIRPVRPPGIICDIFACVAAAAGSVFTAGYVLTGFHRGGFTIFANPDFTTALVFILAILFCHIKYRLISETADSTQGLVSQIAYGVAGLLLLCALAAEWYWHCTYNLERPGLSDVLFRGQVIIFAAMMLLFVIRPVRPRGVVCGNLAVVLAGVGAAFVMIVFAAVHTYSYVIFANTNFVIALLFVAALFAAARLLRNTSREQKHDRRLAVVLGLWGVFVLWVLLNEEIYLYWYCRNRFYRPLPNWEFLAHMYISVMWAIYGAVLIIVGFWRNMRILRYMALGLFALLLLKVFLWDTRRIPNIYRIAAFLATGVTMVGMSYIYQFLKKKGFFEAVLTEKRRDD